jgi:hypothetical protein
MALVQFHGIPKGASSDSILKIFYLWIFDCIPDQFYTVGVAEPNYCSSGLQRDTSLLDPARAIVVMAGKSDLLQPTTPSAFTATNRSIVGNQNASKSRGFQRTVGMDWAIVALAGGKSCEKLRFSKKFFSLRQNMAFYRPKLVRLISTILPTSR